MSIPALQRGVIVNLSAATELLRPLLRQRRGVGRKQLRVLACAPSDVTPVERYSVQTCILKAGASSVIIVPEPLAAAVGSGIDIGSRYAKFLVDFGDGVTDCAIIRDGQIVASLAERVGCADLRRIVKDFAYNNAGVIVSDAEAERVLRRVGLKNAGEEGCLGVRRGMPAHCFLPVAELHVRLWPAVCRMLAPIRVLLREAPAAVGAEIIEDGIFLTGGGALLPGMRDAVEAGTSIETRVVADPLGAVIRGACTMLPFAASLDLWRTWSRPQRLAGPVGAPRPEFSE